MYKLNTLTTLKVLSITLLMMGTASAKPEKPDVLLTACKAERAQHCGRKKSQSLRKCLNKHSQMLSKPCAKQLKKSLAKVKNKPLETVCKNERKQFCRKKKGASLRKCLSKRMRRLSKKCAKRIQHSNAKTKNKPMETVCKKERKQFCAKKKGTSLRKCLSKRMRKLSKKCAKRVQRSNAKTKNKPMKTVCKKERKQFCAKKKGAKLGTCLRKYEKRLSLPCSAQLKQAANLRKGEKAKRRWTEIFNGMMKGAAYELTTASGTTHVANVKNVTPTQVILKWGNGSYLPSRFELKDNDILVDGQRFVANQKIGKSPESSGSSIYRQHNAYCFHNGPAKDAGVCDDVCFAELCIHKSKGLVSLSGQWSPDQWEATRPGYDRYGKESRWAKYFGAFRKSNVYKLATKSGDEIEVRVAEVTKNGMRLKWTNASGPKQFELRAREVVVDGERFPIPDKPLKFPTMTTSIVERGDAYCFHTGPGEDAGMCDDVCFSEFCIHRSLGFISLGGQASPDYFESTRPGYDRLGNPLLTVTLSAKLYTERRFREHDLWVKWTAVGQKSQQKQITSNEYGLPAVEQIDGKQVLHGSDPSTGSSTTYALVHKDGEVLVLRTRGQFGQDEKDSDIVFRLPVPDGMQPDLHLK